MSGATGHGGSALMEREWPSWCNQLAGDRAKIPISLWENLPQPALRPEPSRNAARKRINGVCRLVGDIGAI